MQSALEVTALQSEEETRRAITGKFVRDVFFANLPLPFQKIRTYLWLVLFSRLFGPTGFGIWALFLTTLSFSLQFTGMTQGGAMMRFLSGDRSQEETNRAFSSVLAAVLVSSVICALPFVLYSAEISKLLFRDPRGPLALVLVAVAIPFETVFEMMRGLLRARRLNRSWAFFTLARQAPETVVLIVICWWWIRDPIGAIGGYVISAVLGVTLGWFYLKNYQQTRLVKPSRAVIVKYVPYGLALVPAALTASLSFAADRYLVGYYLDLRQVGIYSVCFTVSALGFFFVGPLNDVLLPEMATLHDAADWDMFHTRFSQVQKFVIGMSIGATALLVSFPRQILQVLTTRDFSSGASTLAVLGLQGIFMSFVMLYAVMFLVHLRVWWTTVIWGSMGVLILIIDVILLPRIGILGAGFSQLISAIAGAGLVVGMNRKLFLMTFRFEWIPQTGAALFCVWLLARFWRTSAASFSDSLLHIMVGAFVFLFSLWLTRYFRVNEVIALRRALLNSRA